MAHKSLDRKQDQGSTQTPSAGPDGAALASPLYGVESADAGLIIQPKLAVGPAGDHYEREADRVAREVMQMPAPAVHHQKQGQAEAPLAPASLQRRITPIDGSTETVRTKSFVRQAAGGQGFETGPDVEAQINQQRSGGSPLPDAVRAFMEPRFGADFSGVRVHTNREADQLNHSLQARAFTTGQHIFFKRSDYHPGSNGGRALLAHELTHVVQQRGDRSKPEANPIGVIQRWPDVQGPEDVVIWIAVIIGILLSAYGIKRYITRNRVIREAQADPTVQSETLKLISGNHGDEAKIYGSAASDSRLTERLSIIIQKNSGAEAEASSDDDDEFNATLRTAPPPAPSLARPTLGAQSSALTTLTPTIGAGLTSTAAPATQEPAKQPLVSMVSSTMADSGAAASAAATAAAGGPMPKTLTPMMSESKSKASADAFGQEMAQLGTAGGGGKYHFHYGVNIVHPEFKGVHPELGIRADAMSRYGGTVGEFSFKPEKYLKAGGVPDYQLIHFNSFFNQSITAPASKAAKYAGAAPTGSGQTSKYLASNSANPTAGTTMGIRFSKASMVYSVMRNGHIHFHLEDLGGEQAVMSIVNKEGTYKDAVTSSELRYVRRFWDRGFPIMLPRGFFSGGYDSGDDEPEALEQNNSFKGFKGHVTFYKKAPDKSGKIITMPPPWKG